MQSIEEVKEEEELKKKINQKRRIRGVLIAVNALLISYTGFLAVSSIVDLVNKNNGTNIGDIITVLDKTENESKKIYDSFAHEKADIIDVATYGKYLLTSKSKITYELDKYTDSVRLVNLKDAIGSNSIKSESISLGNKFNEQIDLFSLTNGDYIIHDALRASNFVTFHYTGVDYFSETIYSFPDKEGKRTKITLKGKDSSPALIVNVTTQVDLPSSYYDIVIIKDPKFDDENIGAKWFENTQLKVKEVTSLKEAYRVNASYAVNIIEGDSIFTSNYVNENTLKPSLIENGVYDSLDSDNAIRELGGYVFNAGAGIKGNEEYAIASREIMTVKNNSHIGKYALSIGKDIINPYTSIQEIFEFEY